MTETVTFALITADAAWTARNRGTRGDGNRVYAEVPADGTEKILFGGREWLRHRFADCPKDIPNATVMCPAHWVPESADALALTDDSPRARMLAATGRTS